MIISHPAFLNPSVSYALKARSFRKSLSFFKSSYLKVYDCICSREVVSKSMENSWLKLGTPARELRLEVTLPTGQSFRWREISPGKFLGVIGQRAVVMRQLDNDVCYRVVSRTPHAGPEGDSAALADYFNLSVCLSDLTKEWSAVDPNFASLSEALPGARMLRQDPVECLFSFICSQNNHISRIHGMVNKLCELYGTELPAVEKRELDLDMSTTPPRLFAFPTLTQLSQATEEELRASGFGYRARFIVDSVAELLDKSEGGEVWLSALRAAPFDEVTSSLCTLPGVGPKVAACCALFSLDKHDAIPVDTHVWQLALRRYTPQLRGKTLTPKLHGAVQAALHDTFGSHCGWAHNTLFIAELSTMKDRVAAAIKGVKDTGDTREVELCDADYGASEMEESSFSAGSSFRSGSSKIPETPPLLPEAPSAVGAARLRHRKTTKRKARSSV